LRLGKYVNNISGLQLINFLRFIIFLLASIVFTKSHLTKERIGDFEMMMFIYNLVSFFWVTGIIQSLLTIYNNNTVFPGVKNDPKRKSPEIFNAFILLSVFSLIIFATGHIMKGNLYVYKNIQEIPHVDLLLWYILLNNPTNLIEYIYLLRNQSKMIFIYGVTTYFLQLVLLITPIFLGLDIDFAFRGLIWITGLRWIWLVVLLYKYAEFKVSFPFIRAHLKLGYPLIISSLLSGSAQYVDNFLVALNFDRGDFALFRYGAKEMPFVVMLANGLHSAMLPEFSTSPDIRIVLARLRHRSRRLINLLFPITFVLLLSSNWIFIHMFNPSFRPASDVFMVYLLLIVSRLIFPQTILIGLQKTKPVMIASILEVFFNIVLSLILIPIYHLTGVVLATVLVFTFEKICLMTYLYYKLGIKPQRYVPLKLYLFYSIILILLFVLIDHRIIMLYVPGH
jgi:O-antigen/teichoic acid export membrane protein